MFPAATSIPCSPLLIEYGVHVFLKKTKNLKQQKQQTITPIIISQTLETGTGCCWMMKQWKVMGVFVNLWLTDLSRSSSTSHTSFYCIWGTRVHFLKQMHVKAVPIWQQCNQVPTQSKPPAYLPIIYLNITGLPAPTKMSVSVPHYLTYGHLHYLSRVPLTIPPLLWNVMCITKNVLHVCQRCNLFAMVYVNVTDLFNWNQFGHYAEPSSRRNLWHCIKYTPLSDVYWTVHHRDSWRILNQLDITCCIYFIS